MTNYLVYDCKPEGVFAREAFKRLVEGLIPAIALRFRFDREVLEEKLDGHTSNMDLRFLHTGVTVDYHMFGQWVQVRVRGEEAPYVQGVKAELEKAVHAASTSATVH